MGLEPRMTQEISLAQHHQSCMVFSLPSRSQICQAVCCEQANSRGGDAVLRKQICEALRADHSSACDQGG